MVRNAAGIVIYRLVDNTPEVLVLYNGRWSPPKGGREKDETEMENAVRETLEESGISADDITMNETYRYQFEYTRFGVKRIVVFLAEIKDPNHAVKISHEHTDFKWMRFEEAVNSRNHAPSNTQFAEMYKDAFDTINKLIKGVVVTGPASGTQTLDTLHENQ